MVWCVKNLLIFCIFNENYLLKFNIYWFYTISKMYGPSLPTLINTQEFGLRADTDQPELILPHDYDGVKSMSYGFVSKGQRAVMRGPMVSGLINQLISKTNWGELDYLILDLPPGTGDIAITLCQEIPINAALIVTTPPEIELC
jgi:ATP-binding protein involved in chromosome partitioning